MFSSALVASWLTVGLIALAVSGALAAQSSPRQKPVRVVVPRKTQGRVKRDV